MRVENNMCSVLADASILGSGSVLAGASILGSGSVLDDCSVLGCFCAGSGPHLGFSGPSEEHAGLEATGSPVLGRGVFWVWYGFVRENKMPLVYFEIVARGPTDPNDTKNALLFCA